MLNIYNQQNQQSKPTPSGAKPTAGETDAKKINANTYQDPTGEFDSKEFRYAIWYAKHKVLLYKIAVGVLVGTSVILWAYSLFVFGEYLIFGYSADKTMMNSLSKFSDYTAFRPLVDAKPLQIFSPTVLTGGTNKYDFAAEVTNPNQNFIAHFDYYFVTNGQPTKKIAGFVLAGESRFLTYLGVSSTEYGGSADIVLENVAWQRVSAKKIPDVNAWQKYRLDFAVSDFTLTPVDPETPGVSIVKFKLTNNSAFGYKNPEFLVKLLNQGSIVGLMRLELESLSAGETREVDLRNFVSGLQVTDVALEPMIDIFDKSVFITPGRE